MLGQTWFAIHLQGLSDPYLPFDLLSFSTWSQSRQKSIPCEPCSLYVRSALTYLFLPQLRVLTCKLSYCGSSSRTSDLARNVCFAPDTLSRGVSCYYAPCSSVEPQTSFQGLLCCRSAPYLPVIRNRAHQRQGYAFVECRLPAPHTSCDEHEVPRPAHFTARRLPTLKPVIRQSPPV